MKRSMPATAEADALTSKIIGSAIEVHRLLGPSLLESAYLACLVFELRILELPLQVELPLPLTYKNVSVDCGYRLDFVVARTVIVEVKAVEALASIHEAQLLTYLKLTGWVC
jgi:GxxExxY protein